MTVLEVGEYVSAPYGGKLLSDLGARVIKIEPPNGDIARSVGPFPEEVPDANASGFFGYLNTGKHSIIVDPSSAQVESRLSNLIGRYDVDIVIENRLPQYEVEPASLLDQHSDLVVVSITGFGTTGPWRGYHGPEIISTAESGQMNKMGYPHRPPSRLRIKNTDYMGGQYAALAALSAIAHKIFQGGTGQHIDVSKREAGAASLEYFLTGYSWSGHTTERQGNGYPKQGNDITSWTISETSDGHISASVGGNWEIFCSEFLDRPELLEDERFVTREARADNREAVNEIIESYLQANEKWDLFWEFQEHGIPSAVTATPADIVSFEHLKIRDFWQEIPLPNGTTVTMPGFPFRVNHSRVDMNRAPKLGEHTAEYLEPLDLPMPHVYPSGTNASNSINELRDVPKPAKSGEKPLSGIKVIDFTWVGAGPQATKLLAALGADVVKIESHRSPDILRRGRGFSFDTSESLDVSAFYAEFNQGKRGIQLDLNTDTGREIALELIAEADVLAENFSPNFMERISLEYDDVREVNPDIIYLSLPGWGKEGPAQYYRSYGNNLQSMAGLDWISGFPDDPPTTSGQSWPDPVAGVKGALSVVMALIHRHLAGEGTYIEVPQYEMAVSLMHKPLMEYLFTDELPDRIGNRDEDFRYVQGIYECAGEDRWAAIAIGSNSQWERFCSIIGKQKLTTDNRFQSHDTRLEHHDQVDRLIQSWTQHRSPEEVRTTLQSHNIPAGIVADEQDLMDFDPQLRIRDFIPENDHPVVGRQRYGGIPFQMSEAVVRLDRHPPCLGEHTTEVLTEWLDWDEEKVTRLKEDKILY